jgi:hypothetical protein
MLIQLRVCPRCWRNVDTIEHFLEFMQRRIASLHQNTAIGSTDITDLWEPLEEGLLPLETTRHVSMITITLSTKELDKTSIGYTSWTILYVD